jgi:hypothetical protein
MEQPADLGPQIGERKVQSLAPRIEYDAPLGTQQLQFEADSFAHAAADAVTHHGITECAGSSEADFGPGRFSCFRGTKAKSREAGTRIA